MIKNTLFWILLFALTIGSAQTPANDASWILLFEDNCNSLPDSEWEIWNNKDHYGEKLWWRNQNVSDSSGYWLLTTKNETYTFNNVTHYFGTGGLQTSSDFTYGYFEVRCKLQWGIPFWDGIWLQTGAYAGCNYAELDLVEHDGSNYDYNSNNFHYSSPMFASPCLGQYEENQKEYFNFTQFANLNGYHIWGCEWSPNIVIYYLDGVELRRMANNGRFIQSMPLILTAGVHKEFTNINPLPSISPTTMSIDYVKVYKKNRSNSNCNSLSDATISTFTGYTPNLKHNITISNNVSVPSSSSVILHASNEISIGTNFTVPLGSEFGAIITGCYTNPH